MQRISILRSRLLALPEITSCCRRTRWSSTTSPHPAPPEAPSSTNFPPLQSSQSHNSLSTFLKHAQQSGLSPTSTVYAGTYYEYLCHSSLMRLGFDLTRRGGRADKGIDLIGTWQLPSQPHPIRCVVQCKALGRKAGPNLVRELEGAFAGAPEGWGGENVVGVLCATKEATKGVREAVRNSGRGLVWVLVEGIGGREGRIRQAVWNERVGELGAEGVGVGVAYLPSGKGGEVEQEISLTWKGEIWTPGTKSVEGV